MSSGTAASFEQLRLRTPPIPRVVPDGVFDDYGWCESDWLDLRRDARFEITTPSLGDNPPGLAFLLADPPPYLPRELARLHVGSLAREGEWALAPYAIDDATDELHAHRARPRDLLSLAATNLDALVWGLHDWCHFHNHGPFEKPAWTEVQCDSSALVWLWQNRRVLGVSRETWEARRAQLAAIATRRFADEGLSFEPTVYESARLLDLADATRDRRVVVP